MRPKFASLTMIALLSAAGISSAFAFDFSQVEKVIPLKDGSTVYLFQDGKMAMERYGQAAYMKPGETMETKDGQKIIMEGNEVWRLDSLLNESQRG